MSGAASGVAAAPLSTGRLVRRRWKEPVAVVGLGGAVAGEVATPPGLEPAVVRGPFADVKLPGAPAAPAALALSAALGHALSGPTLGELPPPEERALVVGTRAAALSETIRFMEAVSVSGPSLVNPGLFPFTVMNAAAGLAAIRYECAGPNLTLNNGATSALDAVFYAADLVASGRATLALAGGFEGLGERASKALGRRGEPAEIAAVIALCTPEAARRAGGRPLALLLAAATGARSEVPAEEARREIAAAALAAAAPPAAARAADSGRLDDPAAAGSFPVPAAPEDLLFELLTAVAGAARTGEDRALLLAGDADRPAATALVIERLADS